MEWTTGAAIYVVIWWIVIFAILPWGVEALDESDIAKGHASSAPRKPRILFKMVVTTVVAAIIWGVIYLIAGSGAISLRG